jgi:hypothetical protein
MGGILDVACCCVTTDCFVSVSNGSCIFRIGESHHKTSHLTSASSRHACPIYITVEEGLDKLSGEETKTDFHKEFKERSLSCETQLEVGQPEDLRYRHNSSPDMSVFTHSTYLNEFSRGSYHPMILISFISAFFVL